MSDLVHARVVDNLTRLRLGHVAQCIDALLSEAAKADTTYLDFLDRVLGEELARKQRRRISMHVKIAHFPTVKTLGRVRLQVQPSIDQKLVRELATGRYIANAENVLVFGPPGVGKTHLAIALGRAAVETGHSVLFVSATTLLAALHRVEAEGQLDAKLLHNAKPKLLVIDELGYLPFEKRAAHLFFQLVARRYEKGSMLLTTNQVVSQWGAVFGDDVLAAAILDRLMHHSHTLMIQGELQTETEEEGGPVRSFRLQELTVRFGEGGQF